MKPGAACGSSGAAPAGAATVMAHVPLPTPVPETHPAPSQQELCGTRSSSAGSHTNHGMPVAHAAKAVSQLLSCINVLSSSATSPTNGACGSPEDSSGSSNGEHSDHGSSGTKWINPSGASGGKICHPHTEMHCQLTGPRRFGEGVEDAEQGILSAEQLPSGVFVGPLRSCCCVFLHSYIEPTRHGYTHNELNTETHADLSCYGSLYWPLASLSGRARFTGSGPTKGPSGASVRNIIRISGCDIKRSVVYTKQLHYWQAFLMRTHHHDFLLNFFYYAAGQTLPEFADSDRVESSCSRLDSKAGFVLDCVALFTTTSKQLCFDRTEQCKPNRVVMVASSRHCALSLPPWIATKSCARALSLASTDKHSEWLSLFNLVQMCDWGILGGVLTKHFFARSIARSNKIRGSAFEAMPSCFTGQVVGRLQRVCGVEFTYSPPPRSIVPQAASLKGHAGRWVCRAAAAA
eukprot:351361-Chlamydomonas_euryale.AAC.5